jgi:D-amino-acid dehydrogenase
MISADECGADRAGAGPCAARELAGGSFTAEDESGDAHQFTQALAARCAAPACASCSTTRITALRTAGDRIDHVEVADDQGRCPAPARRCLRAGDGCLQPAAAAPLGIRLPIYPAKGYSVTLPVADAARATRSR